jgi:hypothetical protein
MNAKLAKFTKDLTSLFFAIGPWQWLRETP